MENCTTRDYTGIGYGASEYVMENEFKEARKQISSFTASLRTKKNKKEFRDECLKLIDYLITIKDNPPKYTNPKRWVPVLRNYFGNKFDKLTQYGGCPMTFDKKDRDLLELKYNALDFCGKNISYKNKLFAFRKGGSSTYSCNNNSDCIKHCKEYEEWFISKKEYFESNRNLISESCIFKNTSSQFPEKNCNILDTSTFNKLPQCLLPKPDASTQAPTEQKEISRSKLDQVNAEDSPVSQDQSPSQVERPPDGQHSPSERQPSSLPEGSRSDQSQLQTTAEDRNQASLTNLDKDTQDSITQKPDAITHSSSSQEILTSSIVKSPGSPELEADSHIKTIPAATDVSHPKPPPTTPVDSKIQGNINSTFFSIFYALMGKFKKKKNIRRKVKFLRILLPSHSVKKDILLSDDHLDQTIHDDEEIIKKLKIHEHNTINNTNMLKRKKDRSKTIIEVHMEVLEEFRNEEWELKKGEFLAVCLEEYKYEKHRTYPNLINGDQMENIKCSNDIEEKKIIWNKWIEMHRNLSEKLKKEDWFNNLKNEWKKEKAMVNETEELNKKYLNENEKGSHLEREKDAWRGWISNRGKIVEHYLEQDWLKGLTNEFDNILDEYENEGTENSVSLINIEEMEHNKSCEELYKYIKKKLLSKLCVLVFMTILEECKKEKNVENKESYLDSSINECNSEKNLDRKYHIIENVVEKGNNVLENSENTEIFDYKEENNFTDEIKDWIGEDDIHVNSI
ncbi:STP1 protein [Plasmodium malariae]|uniref:STP1 protein n=1 Tax=Plasmodium malariae TaxID=5858 RepID=A0A1D3TDR1_PLAMA|nr:STP1 protein [Plasmodium malariae]SCP03049.1 STP1 protein [Plasmodium malariae]